MDEETFAFGSFRLIPAQRILLEDGKPLRLGSRAFDILVTLVETAGETVRKDQLIVRAWPDTVVDEGALRVHVAALRKALGDGRAGKRYIANNPGRGYTFVAPVIARESAVRHPPRRVERPIANNLPVPLTGIVGRHDIVAALADATGPAPSSDYRRSGRDRQNHGGGGGRRNRELRPMQTAYGSSGSPRYPIPTWCRAPSCTVLGISPSGANPLSGLAAWLRDKHALIVLDSCEHVIDAVAALAEAVLKAAPRVRILVTSREPLRAEGEWLHRLASLELPPDSIDLSAAEALRVFGSSAVQRARHGGGGRLQL